MSSDAYQSPIVISPVSFLCSFLIADDGVVYEGAGWGVAGAHTYGYNRNGTGIAFIGNYVGE